MIPARRCLTQALCVAALGFAASLAAAIGPAQPSGDAKLPADELGARVSAYLAAFNSGDDAVMERFFKENLAPESLARRPMADRLAMNRRIRGDFKSLAPRAVLDESPSSLTVLLEAGSGEFVRGTFTFEPEPPHGLLGIRFEPGDPNDAAGPPPAMTEAEALAAIRSMVDGRAKADEFAGTVLVANGGKSLLLGAWGLASREFGVPNRIDTKYNLGSINKLFTKLAIGQLIEEGKLSFGTTLGEVLPDYPNSEARRKVTVRDLLEMRSGIGDFFGERFEATPKNRLRTNADFLRLFADEPLAFEPGSQQQYSNGGYIVLGAIVEKVSGRSYYDYVREHIFVPAGMRDTDSYEADVPVPNLAEGYTHDWDGGRRDAGPRHTNIYTRPARGSAAGGGYSTAEDLLRFVNAVLSNRLLSPPYTDWYLTGVEPKDGAPRQPRDRGGLGWAGGAPGINSAVDLDLEHGYVVIVLGNLDPPAALEVSRQIRRLLGAVKD